MKTWLLIHGGSHGAWCWEAVIQELERLGEHALAINLPGAGADHTPRTEVTFDACVAAVTAAIETADWRNLVLVGHSLAGILMPSIAAWQPQRISELVFIAAFVLDQGERAFDLIAPERQPDYRRLADASPDQSLSVPYALARERFFSDLDEVAAKQAFARLTPQPFKPYLHPALVGARAFGSQSRYVLCTQDRNLSYEQCLGFASKLGCPVEEIVAGHDVMLSRPAELARLLVAGDQV